MEPVYILSAARTAIGAFQSAFKDVAASKLGSFAIKEAVRRAGIVKSDIDECLMGCVLTAGLGQAPARQAAIFADLPNSVRCTTLNRVCGSGIRSVMWAAQMIQCGDANVVVAGGMENMTRAPYLLEKAREGFRMGHGKIIDSMIQDGLWDVYNNYHMGDAGELCAKEKNIDRKAQDDFAKQSYLRSIASIEKGLFKEEIVEIEVLVGKETKKISQDEEPFRAKLDKFQELRPAFSKDGTITAANASSLSDGAAALVLASESYVKKHNLKPIAKIVAQASHAQAPEWFTTAPIGAIQKALTKANLKTSDIDLYEINEAFSVVALACIRDLNLAPEKVNVRGGAVAMGHPIGASGARILTTLIHALRQENKKYGLATLCIGGGEASALIVEKV